jgi:hypothetical protein
MTKHDWAKERKHALIAVAFWLASPESEQQAFQVGFWAGIAVWAGEHK